MFKAARAAQLIDRIYGPAGPSWGEAQTQFLGAAVTVTVTRTFPQTTDMASISVMATKHTSAWVFVIVCVWVWACVCVFAFPATPIGVIVAVTFTVAAIAECRRHLQDSPTFYYGTERICWRLECPFWS